MALYSRPDYYVKTFTARNCSLRITTIEIAAPLNLNESGRRPFHCEPKQNVCLSRPRPCWLKSLISVWARWPSGGSAHRMARCPFLSVPVQPTPSGGFEKVRFAIPSYTEHPRDWMRNPRLECPPGDLPARPERSEAVRNGPERASPVLTLRMRTRVTDVSAKGDSRHREGGRGARRTCMAATCGTSDPNTCGGPSSVTRARRA